MAFGLPQYNPQEIKDEYDLIPDGVYNAVIESAEQKISSAGHGYVSLMVNITGPNYAGRKVFDSLFFWPVQGHSSGQTMINMANKKRAMIGEAINNMGWDAPEEIIGKPILVKVAIDKSKDPQYDDKNVIKKYMVDKGAVTAPAPQSSGQTAAASSAPPWAR